MKGTVSWVNEQCVVGWAEKWKNDIFKCADMDYCGTLYIKQGSIEKIEFSKF